MASSNTPPFVFSRPVFVIVPIISGTVSFLSSLSVAVYILRSRSKVVYHRILFLISISDMLSSLAITLGTLPMPADVILPYAFPSYGTTATCEAQGFAYHMGVGCVVMLGVILNIYYLCKLRYGMEDVTFSKKIEPWSYGIVFLIVLVMFILVLIGDGFNPMIDPWCSIGTYPPRCHAMKMDAEDCRGAKVWSWWPAALSLNLIVAIFSIIVTMALIVHSFWKVEKSLKQHIDSSPDHVEEDSDDYDADSIKAQVLQLRDSRRTVTKQSMMYFTAFFLTWSPLLLRIFFRLTNSKPFVLLRMIFQPLQGFFNMLIFFYHKICTLRENENNLTFTKAIRILIVSPQDVPECVAVGNIDFVTSNDGRLEVRKPSVAFVDPFQGENSTNNKKENDERRPYISVEDSRKPSNATSTRSPNLNNEIVSAGESSNTSAINGLSWQNKVTTVMRRRGVPNDLKGGVLLLVSNSNESKNIEEGAEILSSAFSRDEIKNTSQSETNNSKSLGGFDSIEQGS